MNRTVSDVMVTPVVSVQPATSFKQTVRLLQEHRVSALPVVDRDRHLLGIVSETDLALKEEHHPSEPIPFFEGGRHREQRAKARGTTAADFMSCPWPRWRRERRLTPPPGCSTSAACGTCRWSTTTAG